MSFKIVETIEKGKYVLTTVPEFWENQSNLRWPKFKSEKLRRDSYSTPEDNWPSMSCIVKRRNITSFEEAQTELKTMSNTDQEIVSQHMRSQPKNTQTDFNKLARECFETQAQKHEPLFVSKIRSEPSESAEDSHETILSNISKPEAVQPVQVQAYEYTENVPKIENLNSDTLIDTHEENCQEFGKQQASMTNTDLLIATTNDISSKLSTLETKVDNFIGNSSKNQIMITLNQEQIMQKLSEISAQFDEFIKRSSTLHLTRTEDSNKGIKNISNEENFNEFEELLKNKRNVVEMTKVYSVVCGEGKGRAINNAYALSDAMFDRNFLKQCSWAGGSRGETSKICFKTYKRTINFFFQIIHRSDKQFTILECESFFKNILRNAKKRCESKQLKTSAQKRRPKKKELEHKKNESPVFANEEIKGPNGERATVSEKVSESPIIEMDLVNQELEDDI